MADWALHVKDSVQALVVVALPEGETFDGRRWDAPCAPYVMPEVELFRDGVLFAAGLWPNLVPVAP